VPTENRYRVVSFPHSECEHWNWGGRGEPGILLHVAEHSHLLLAKG